MSFTEGPLQERSDVVFQSGRYLADFKRETSIDAIVTGAN